MVFQPRKNATNKRVIYIHGGAFVFTISSFHYDFIARVAKATGATIYIPIYPYSTPTYSSNKDTIKMLIDLYKKLLLKNDHHNISVMGDSAGGNFALVSAQQFKLNGLPPPNNVIALSPAVDLYLTDCELDKQMKIEPVLPKHLMSLVFD
jgi:acetyl esterase/lipase